MKPDLTVGRLTEPQMRQICPVCADEMKTRGVKRTSVKMRDVQAVLFDKNIWTQDGAYAWLKANEFRSDMVLANDETFRFVQFGVKQCVADIVVMDEDYEDGIRFVVGKYDATKEESLDQRTSRIRSAFYDEHQQPPSNSMNNVWVRDVYEDHLIIDAGEDGLFEVAYSFDAEDNIVFDERDKWKKVELEYVPVKAESDLLFAPGSDIKTTDDGHLQGYLVTFGDETTPDDSFMKDFFTQETDFGFPAAKTSIKTPIYFHHALPLKAKQSKKVVRYAEKMGEGTLTMDEKGVFIDAVLTNTKYRDWIYETVKGLGWSSGTAGHLVERETKSNGTHYVKRWPLGLDASVTPSPADSRNRAIANVKSLLEQNIEIDEPTERTEGGGEPVKVATVPAQGAPLRHTLKTVMEDLKVKPEEIKAISDAVLAQLKSETDAKAAADAKVAADAAALETQIKAAAEKLVDEKLAALKGGKILNAGGKVENKNSSPALNLKTGLGDDAFKSFAYFVKSGDATPIRTGEAYEEWKRQYEFEMKTDYHLLEGTQYQGQEAVPTEVLKVIIEKRDPLSVIRAAGSTVYPANSNAAVIPIEKTAAQVFGITTINGSNTFTTLTEQPLDKLTATVYLFTYNVPIDLQLIDDAVFGVEGWLSRRIGRGWAKTENKYGLVGTGSSEPGGAVTGSTLGVTAAAAAALTAAEVVEHYYKLAGEYRDNVVWVMRGATEGAIRKLAVSTTFPFVGTGGTQGGVGQSAGLNALAAGTGWLVDTKSRVFNTDAMDALAASKKPVLVGNFEAGYAIAERKMLTVLRDPYSEAGKGITNLWWYVREGMGVVNADALQHILTPSA